MYKATPNNILKNINIQKILVLKEIITHKINFTHL